MASGVDTYFSVIALFILFRETLEASIIVSVLLQFLSRSFPQLRTQVWWGVGCGVFVSICFGVIFSCVYYVAKSNVFTGENKSIFKGSIAWFAGILIAILAFAMLRYKGWETKIKRKLETLAEKELEKEKNKLAGGEDVEAAELTWRQRTRSCMKTTFKPVSKVATAFYHGTNNQCARFWDAVFLCCGKMRMTCRRQSAEEAQAAEEAERKKAELMLVPQSDAQAAVTAKHGWGIFLLVFSTVVREGIESVVFLAGVGNAAPSSLPLPGLVGIICGVAFGMFLYYSGRTVKDIKWFLIIMSVVLFFIAGGQFMLGANFLMTGGMFGYCSPWITLRPWTMQPLWDWSGCCSTADDGNKFFALARAIFGFQPQPSFIELITYAIYWTIVIIVGAIKWYKGSLFDADYKWNREQRKLAKQQEAEAQLTERVPSTEEALMQAKKLGLSSADSKDEVALPVPDSGSDSPTQGGSSRSPSQDVGGPQPDAPLQAPTQQNVQQ